jgi:hypothetical protein
MFTNIYRLQAIRVCVMGRRGLIIRVASCVSITFCYCRQEAVGPIEWLQQQKVEVRITRTPYEPRIYFAYTDPTVDQDESRHMHSSKMLEPVITEVSALPEALHLHLVPIA